MADFPNLLQFVPAGTIGSLTSVACPASDVAVLSAAGVTGGGTWPASNRALYVAFLIQETVIAYQMGFEVTVQSGNYDIGIYDVLGNRLVSTGSTAVPVAGIATANITDTTLTPGTYFMALNIDNTTAAVVRQASSNLWYQVCGVQQQAVGAVTLPDPATFANPTTGYLPGIHVSVASTL